MPISSESPQSPVDPLARQELNDRLESFSDNLLHERLLDNTYKVSGAMFNGVESPPDTRVSPDLSANTIRFGTKALAIASMHPVPQQLGSHFRMLLQHGTVLVNLASTSSDMVNDMTIYGSRGATPYLHSAEYDGIRVGITETGTRTLDHPQPGPGNRPIEIREYTVTLRDGDQVRSIPAIQVTNWPDKTAIPEPQLHALVTLIGERHQQSLQAYRTTHPGKTNTPVPVVHCIGGAGRTGMVICAMQISAGGNPYSLQRIIMDLRRQRSSNSVQTEAQLNALVDYAQQRGTPLMHNWNGYDITARLGLFAEGIDEQTGRINAFRYTLKDSTGDDTPAQRALLSRFDAELITLENKLSEAGQQLNALTQDPDFVAMSDAQKIQRMQAQLANLYLHSADDLQRKIHGIGMPHGDEELAMAFSELLDGQRGLHAQRHYLLPAQEAGAPPSSAGLTVAPGANADTIKTFNAGLKRLLGRVLDYTADLMNDAAVYDSFTNSKPAAALFDIEHFLEPVTRRLEHASTLSSADQALIGQYLPRAEALSQYIGDLPPDGKAGFDAMLADLETLHTQYQDLTRANLPPDEIDLSTRPALQVDNALERRLTAPDQFVLCRLTSGEIEILRFKPGEGITRTPIQRNDQGILMTNKRMTDAIYSYTVDELRHDLINLFKLTDVSIPQDIAPAPLSDYELSPENTEIILDPANRLRNPDNREMNHSTLQELWASTAERSAEARLRADANSYDFARAAARRQPAPPTLSTLDPAPFVRIVALLHASPGLVVDAHKNSVWTQRLLTDYAAFWRAQGVRTLYLDVLFAEFQTDLQQFNTHGTLSRRLSDHVVSLDRGATANPHYSYRALLEAAQKNGIEIVATGSAITRQYDPWLATRRGDQALRAKAAMYYTSRAIEQHRQTKPSGEKWLALTSLESGLGPADTPELSRLTGAIKLRVQTDETSHAPLKIESDAGSNPPDGRAAGFVLHTPASSDAHQLRDGWWSRYHPAQQTILTQVVLLRRQVQAYLDTHTGFFSHERRPALADFNHRLEAIETALRGTQNAAPDQVATTISRITQGDLRLMTVAELKVNASEPLKKLGPSYQIILEGLAELHTRLARPLPSPGPDPLLPSPFVTQQRVLALAEAHSQFLPKFRTLGSELGGTRGEGIVRMAPQALYRPLHPEHNPDGSLRGLCDALTRAVLLDDSPGRLTVVNNLYQAMAQPDDAPSQRFRQAVERMNTPHHTNAMTRWQPDITTFDRAVDHLASQAGDARLALHLGDHTVGMRAWVDGATRRYALYDANLGAWTGIDDSAAFKQNLARLYDAALLERYGIQPDAPIKAFSIHAPPASEDMTDLRLAVRDVTRMLESTHARLARLDHADGGVKLGKYTFTREALYSQRGVLNRLGVTVGGQTIGANTDWSQPIALPRGFILPDTLATPQAGNPQLVGTGMRIYGTYRAVTGSMEQFIQGNTTEGGITLAGAGSMWLSEGVERGALSLGAFLHRSYSHTMSLGASVARRLGAGMARGAGLISQVLTIPFDIYEMHQGFSQFDREKDKLLRQDGLFRGTMATTSLAVGLGIAVAAAAGASASAVAPIGFVFAGGMILASHLYNAVRVVQEIKKSINLSSAQELALASSVYFDGSIDLESEHRILQARYDPEVRKRAEDEASRRVNGNPAPYSAMVYAKPRTVVRVLGTEPRSDHAHTHVVQKATSEIKRFNTEWMVANGVSVRKDTPRPPDNYEIYLAPGSSAIDLAHGLPDSDDNWIVRQGAATALPVLIQAGNSADNGKVTGMPDRANHVQLGSGNWQVAGGTHNDVITLDAHPDDLPGYEEACRQANRLMNYAYVIDGQEGNDTLQIATRFDHCNARGYRIDLRAQTMEVISTSSGTPGNALSLVVGRLSGIENLSQLSAPGLAPVWHEFIGDDQSNILRIGSHGRARGMGGDDLLYVSGSAFADGGEGRDSYYVQMLYAGDRPTLQDSHPGSEAAPSINPVYLDMSIQLISDWKITGRDLIIGFRSGAELTIKDIYRQGAQGRTLDPWTRWEFITQDGFALRPQLPQTLADNQDYSDFKVAAQYVKQADRAYGATEQGIVLDLQTRAINAMTASSPALKVIHPDSGQWNILTPGSPADDGEERTLLNDGAGLVINHDAKDIRLKLRYIVQSSKDAAGKLNRDLRIRGVEFVVSFAGTELTCLALSWLQGLVLSPTTTAGQYTLNFKPGRQPLIMTRDGYRLDWLDGQHTVQLPADDYRALSADIARQTIEVDFPFTFTAAPATYWQAATSLALSTRYQLQGQGTHGNDQLNGTTGADIFRPLGGEDEIHTRGGDDIIIVDAAPGTLKIDTAAQTGSSSGQRTPGHPTLLLGAGSVNDVEFDFDWEDLVIRTSLTDPANPAVPLVKTIHHRLSASGSADIAPLSIVDQQGVTLYWNLDPAVMRLTGYTQVASNQTGSTLTARSGSDNLLLGASQADTLIAREWGATLMMGQDGADRYRVEINAARPEGQPVMFINNRANDGKLDTLEVRTKLTPTEFIWQRSGDDLWLSVKPEDQARQAEPRVVVAGYYQDAGRRHLEVRFVDTGGALQGHIREDQLEALSLDPQQTRSMEDNTDLQAPPPQTLQKLIEEMARFTSPGGVGDASMVRPQDRPVVSLLAPAAA